MAALIPRPPDTRATVWIRHYLSARAFRLSSALSKTVINAGAIADYMTWLSATFDRPRVLPTREKLWELMAQEARSPVHGMEFGVAFGYGTDWWLKRLSQDSTKWDGFDRFTGLPRAWRGLNAGEFDAKGAPPAINDPRVTWHVGDVEGTIEELELDARQHIILFDLDIFEPSLVAWSYIRHSLHPGDLLYFDEAFDADERRLLNEHVLREGHFEFIAATPTALALRVVEIK